MGAKLTIAVVSPFLDKQHGTERCVAEQVERWARDFGYQVHIYSQRVEDLAVLPIRPPKNRREDRAESQNKPDPPAASSGSLIWHKVSNIPGPHLIRFVWWFAANTIRRWWDRRRHRVRFDLVYSPGINCPDADVISVHIVFAEFHRQVNRELSLRRNPVASWPRLIHRRLYYRLIRMLEQRIYTRRGLLPVGVSKKVAEDLARSYGRREGSRVVYHGLDLDRFHPEMRLRLRPEARKALALPDEAFVLLLVGNDWKKKGFACLLEAVGRLDDSNLRVFVVGRDDPAPFRELIRQQRLESRAVFLPPRADVEFYYAAADAYVGPSLEDAFALPPAEAMASGLPVIVSRQTGASEIVLDGVNGLILEDPRDSEKLAQLVRRLRADPALRRSLAENAAQTARNYTWARNAAEMDAAFHDFLSRRKAS